MKHDLLNSTLNFLILLAIICMYEKFLMLDCSGELRYELRILNISDHCDISGTKRYISDLKWFRKGYKQYLSFTITADKTFTATRVPNKRHNWNEILIFGKGMVRLIRCRDLEIGCEDFQTWNYTIFCSMLTMKNQMWSEYTESVTPKTWAQHCPKFLQGVYKIQNGSFDINTLMKFYPEGVKYYWKTYIYVYDRRNELVYCGVIHFHAISFVEKDHIPTVKLLT